MLGFSNQYFLNFDKFECENENKLEDIFELFGLISFWYWLTLLLLWSVFNIYSSWLETVFSNYGSDFDVLISITRILMWYIKNPSECTFFEIVSILIHFQALKFLQLPRNSAIFQFHQILSFPWNWEPQETFACKVSTSLEIITILTHFWGPKMTKITCK